MSTTRCITRTTPSSALIADQAIHGDGDHDADRRPEPCEPEPAGRADYPETIMNEHGPLIPELSAITQPITIGQLLRHTSGIRDQWVLATMASWRMSDDVVTRTTS